MRSRIRGGQKVLKADPYGTCTEAFPATASIVDKAAGDITWTDDFWMAERKKYADRNQPVSIYETDLTQWKNGEELVSFVKKTGLYPCGASSGYGIPGRRGRALFYILLLCT